MSDANVEQAAEGFVAIPAGLGFSDCLQPLYRRIEGESVSIGLVVDRQHSNSMGICHGGALSTLADIAAATGVNVASERLGGTPTINLAMDFISAARMGQWIQADIHLVTVKRRFGFSSGAIVNAERRGRQLQRHVLPARAQGHGETGGHWRRRACLANARHQGRVCCLAVRRLNTSINALAARDRLRPRW